MKVKVLFFLLVSLQVFSQENWNTLLIPKELKEKANSVVQYQKNEVIKSNCQMEFNTNYKNVMNKPPPPPRRGYTGQGYQYHPAAARSG